MKMLDAKAMPLNKRIRFSLRARVALGFALPVFVVMLILSYFHYSREFQLLNEQARIDAIQLGELAIHSLNHAMLTKDGVHLMSTMEDIGQLESVRQIQIIGLSGKVLADNRGQAETRIMDVEDEECQACHQYSAAERPRVIRQENPNNGWRISAPVDNNPQCHGCHDPNQLHLGVLLLDVVSSPNQEHLQADLQLDLLITGLSTALISIGSYFFVHWLVVRRIEALKQPLAEFARGDFSNRIQQSSRLNDELGDLVEVFNQMAADLESKIRAEETRQFVREKAILEERERIARELHDGLAQVLGYVNTKTMAVRLFLKDHKLTEANQHLEDLESAAKGLFVDVRETILGLRMLGRTEYGLVPALGEYVSQFSQLSGVPTALKTPETKNLDWGTPETELHLFRIAQESLSNIRKHSVASQAWVELSQMNGIISMIIRDNGVGFDVNGLPLWDAQRFGIKNMRERAAEIGATIRVESKPGEGTRILVKLEHDGK